MTTQARNLVVFTQIINKRWGVVNRSELSFENEALEYPKQRFSQTYTVTQTTDNVTQRVLAGKISAQRERERE